MDEILTQLSIFSGLNTDILHEIINNYPCNKYEVISLLDDLNVLSYTDNLCNININLAHNLFNDFKFDNIFNEILISIVKRDQSVYSQLIHINYLLYIKDNQCSAIEILNNFISYCDDDQCDLNVIKYIQDMIDRYIILTNDVEILKSIKTDH